MTDGDRPRRRRRLWLAPPPRPDNPTPERADRVASNLEGLARTVRSGRPWNVGGLDRAPVWAAVVVVFGPDGEPTPFVAGVAGGEAWDRDDEWAVLVSDATRALNTYRREVRHAVGAGRPANPWAAAAAEWDALHSVDRYGR